MVAEKMTQLRVRAGLTQKKVAEALGTAQSTIAMWENGISLPRADKLPEIAKLYGCTVDELFGEV